MIEVAGDANDNVDKGLSGGMIVLCPPLVSGLSSAENMIIGNTVLYGATGGSIFASGRAGERFCGRNSGAVVVVEGCGANGCEYMTGVVAVILGSTGANFGSGMTGGMAYLYDLEGVAPDLMNMDTFAVCPIRSSHWEAQCQGLIEWHLRATGNVRAEEILANWGVERRHFIQVCPKEFVSRPSHPLETEEFARTA